MGTGRGLNGGVGTGRGGAGAGGGGAGSAGAAPDGTSAGASAGTASTDDGSGSTALGGVIREVTGTRATPTTMGGASRSTRWAGRSGRTVGQRESSTDQ